MGNDPVPTSRHGGLSVLVVGLACCLVVATYMMISQERTLAVCMGCGSFLKTKELTLFWFCDHPVVLSKSVSISETDITRFLGVHHGAMCSNSAVVVGRVTGLLGDTRTFIDGGGHRRLFFIASSGDDGLRFLQAYETTHPDLRSVVRLCLTDPDDPVVTSARKQIEEAYQDEKRKRHARQGSPGGP